MDDYRAVLEEIEGYIDEIQEIIDEDERLGWTLIYRDDTVALFSNGKESRTVLAKHIEEAFSKED